AIGPDATAEQHTQAYEEAQRHYDMISSGGDFTGVSDAEMQLAAISRMEENGIPTRFDPEVVAAAGEAVKPYTSTSKGVTLQGATAGQRMEALELVQEYVDGVGGVGDVGITAEALPGRADQILRDAGIPTHSSATTRFVEEALDGFDDMNDQARIEALSEASSRLEAAIDGMEPEAAAAVVDQALAPIEARMDQVEIAGSMVDHMWTPAWTSLANIADQVGGTVRGDALTSRIAETFLDSAGGPGNFQMLAPLREQGAGLELFLEIAAAAGAKHGEGASGLVMREVERAMDGFVANELQPALDAYTDHTSELNWLVQNLGPVATPEQLEQAVNEYIDSNPGWQERHDELQAQVAEHGGALLQQIAAMQDLPPGLEESSGADLQSRAKELFEDPGTGFAIATAAGTDPESIAGLDLPDMVSFANGLSLGNKGLGVVKALASAHVQQNVVDPLANIDPNDPASIARARTQISTLRNSAIATALGLDPSRLDDLGAAVDALGDVLPRNGEVLSQADLESRLTQLNERLDGLSAFDKSQPLGQVFRGIGVAAGVASLWGSASNLISDPSLDTGVRALTDAAGLAVSTGDLATGLGMIPESSAWSRFSASQTLGKVLGTVGIGLGLVGVADNLSNGDLAQAGLGLASVGGSALALFGSSAWAGPVGVTIGLVAAAGSFGLNIHRANEAEAQLEGASAPFLESLGFSESAARILSDFSGDGYSSLTLLAEYAQHKGYNLADPADQQEFVDWINGLDGNLLGELRDNLNHVIDGYEGDASKLDGDASRPPVEHWVDPGTGASVPMISIYRPESVGEVDGFLFERDGFTAGSILPRAS
ncbi:MAG: hypothetical protein GX761_12520, partial [Gammaproteobacteria bacterium]|nr:hypothetical protein [Gammaproteobacteria bacterium]